MIERANHITHAKRLDAAPSIRGFDFRAPREAYGLCKVKIPVIVPFVGGTSFVILRVGDALWRCRKVLYPDDQVPKTARLKDDVFISCTQSVIKVITGVQRGCDHSPV